MKQHVLVRFRKRDEIIAQELPTDRALYCSTVVMMLYAKAVAHSALGNVAEAGQEREAFLAAKTHVSDGRRVHNDTVKDLLEIAEQITLSILHRRKTAPIVLSDVARRHVREIRPSRVGVEIVEQRFCPRQRDTRKLVGSRQPTAN